MVAAPTNSNATQVAVTGTSMGAMSRTAGRIRPAAARISRVPMARRAPGLKSRTHSAAGPTEASFSLGTNSLEELTRRTAASSPATIHSARFSVRFMRAPWQGSPTSRPTDSGARDYRSRNERDPRRMTVAARPLRVARYARVSTREKDRDPEPQLQPMRGDAVARAWQPREDVDRAAVGALAGP